MTQLIPIAVTMLMNVQGVNPSASTTPVPYHGHMHTGQPISIFHTKCAFLSSQAPGTLKIMPSEKMALIACIHIASTKAACIIVKLNSILINFNKPGGRTTMVNDYLCRLNADQYEDTRLCECTVFIFIQHINTGCAAEFTTIGDCCGPGGIKWHYGIFATVCHD